MTAPSEAEIREAVADRLAEQTTEALRPRLRELIRDASGPMQWPATYVLDGLANDDLFNDAPPLASEGALWGGDMRRSEAEALAEALRPAVDRAASRCEAIIIDELTAAGVQFAQEYPDAPRAVREPVTA